MAAGEGAGRRGGEERGRGGYGDGGGRGPREEASRDPADSTSATVVAEEEAVVVERRRCWREMELGGRWRRGRGGTNRRRREGKSRIRSRRRRRPRAAPWEEGEVRAPLDASSSLAVARLQMTSSGNIRRWQRQARWATRRGAAAADGRPMGAGMEKAAPPRCPHLCR
uniref:Uncharacterized protein n=1 Tax=Oryza glaberrima TaxID=4538 RepID=I1PA46_ORYGL